MKKFIVGLFLLLGLISAEARPRGIQLVDTAAFNAPARSVFNLNFVDNTYHYEFIDLVKAGGSGVGLAFLGSTRASPGYFNIVGNPTWSTSASGANLDANGWPQNFTLLNTNSVTWGNHINVPDGANYGASGDGYTVQFAGDCRMNFTAGTWSNFAVVSGSVTETSPSNYEGTNGKFTVNYTGAKQLVGWRVTQTGHLTGSYCRNISIYRTADAARFDAGKTFRIGLLDLIKAQNPGFVRSMNWHGANNSRTVRWENRAPTGGPMYGGGYWQLSPPYTDAALCGATANQYCLSSATGMPASMQHGEMATARIATTMTNSRSGGYPITTLNKCATGVEPCNTTGQVVTSVAHPFSVGDRVVFVMGSGSSIGTGMTQSHMYQTTITAVQDTTHFSTGIDTTAFSNFTAGYVAPYITLNVGSRGEYPVLTTEGLDPITSVGAPASGFFNVNDIRTFYFDKTISGSRDGSGNLVAGAWMTQVQNDGSSVVNAPQDLGVPIEVTAAYIKEVNELSPTRPIHMWMVFPCTSLMSNDPDYSAGSNYTYNVINAALGVITDSGIQIGVEYCNEPWNGRKNTDFTNNGYMLARGYYRAAVASQSYTSSYRSVNLVRDIRANVSNTRIRPILAGQGAGGMAVSSPNWNKSFGQSTFYTDPYILTQATISKTGTTNGTTTLSGLGDTSNLTVGMGVIKADVPAGTQISSITNSTTVVMNAAASGSSTGATSFQPTPISYHWAWASGTYIDPPTSRTGSFTAQISGTTMTVTAASGSPALSVNDFIVGTGISTNPNTLITGSSTYNSGACTPACTGAGGNGTYGVSVSQTVGPVAATKAQYMAYATGTKTFTDDSAMYNGTNNTANGGGNYTGAADPTTAINNLVAMMVTGNGTLGESQSHLFFQTQQATYSATFAPMGVWNIQYEGGWEIPSVIGSSYGSHTITSGDQAFILGAQNSAAWSTAQQNFFNNVRLNTMTGAPAIYLMNDCKWGLVSVNCSGNPQVQPDNYSGGVEGGALSPAWTANGTANQSLNFLLKRDLDPASNDNDPVWLEKAA